MPKTQDLSRYADEIEHLLSGAFLLCLYPSRSGESRCFEGVAAPDWRRLGVLKLYEVALAWTPATGECTGLFVNRDEDEVLNIRMQNPIIVE